MKTNNCISLEIVLSQFLYFYYLLDYISRKIISINIILGFLKSNICMYLIQFYTKNKHIKFYDRDLRVIKVVRKFITNLMSILEMKSKN